MICPTCRSEIEAGAKFCVRCGARLEAAGGAGHAPEHGAHAQSPPPADPVAAPATEQPQPQAGFPQYGQAQGAAPDYAQAPPPAAPDSFAAPAHTITGHSQFVLKPLGFGELFDTAIKLYVGNFWVLFGTALIILIPLLITVLVFGGGIALTSATGVTSPTAVMAMVLPMMLVMICIFSMMQGAIVRVISDIYLGGTPSIMKAYGAAFRKLIALVVTSLLYAIAAYINLFVAMVPIIVVVGLMAMILGPVGMFAGMLLAMLPGSYLAVAMLFYICAIMLENKGIFPSLSRSMQLVRGHWFKLFFCLALLFIGLFIIGMVSFWIQMAMSVSSGGFPSQPSGAARIIGFIFQILQLAIMPVVGTVITLFYYDLRIRKEGYDLEIMAREIG